MLVLGIIVVIGGIVFVSFPHIENARTNLVEESAKHQSKNSGSADSSESVESIEPEPEEEPKEVRKFAHAVRDDSIPYKPGEESFIQDVHEMTHQKVEAKDKWGALEAKEENINALLAILDETDFAEEEYFRNVLTTWKAGDFSSAVEIHNKIWNDQDGYNGMAERLLTPEEEQEFVEINFR